jgi:hypothetical protein
MSQEAREPAAGPSFSGTVVLDLGPGAGALVLRTPAGLDGAEIDISLADRVGRTHSMVRPRHTAAGTTYAAVYPGLPPGDYTIWRDPDTPVTTVTVAAGTVTDITVTWP